MSGWERVSQTVAEAAYGTTTAVTATCGGYKKVLGGGYRMIGDQSGGLIVESYPTADNEWGCVHFNWGYSGVGLMAYAVCATVN